MIDKGKILKAEDYQKILGEVLIPNNKNIAHQHILFLQDGETCHTAECTLKFLKENKIDIISDYPSQLPDLNVIENVWGLIKRNIDLTNASTSKEIFTIVEKGWNALPQETIKRLIESMHRRIDAILKSKVFNTKY